MTHTILLITTIGIICGIIGIILNIGLYMYSGHVNWFGLIPSSLGFIGSTIIHVDEKARLNKKVISK